MLIGIHVVVGGWKSHVFAIQNTKAAIEMPRIPMILFTYVYTAKHKVLRYKPRPHDESPNRRAMW